MVGPTQGGGRGLREPLCRVQESIWGSKRDMAPAFGYSFPKREREPYQWAKLQIIFLEKVDTYPVRESKS